MNEEEEKKESTNETIVDETLSYKDLEKELDSQKPKEVIRINLNSVLLAIVILLAILAVLFYIIKTQYEKNNYLYDEIAILSSQVETSDNNISTDTISKPEANTYEVQNGKTDEDYLNIKRHVSNVYNIPNNKEVSKSNVDYDIIYESYPITEHAQIQSLDYIPLNHENEKKYSQKYYTYNKEGLKKEINGYLTEEVYNGYSFVNNLAKISVTKDFNLISRDYERVSNIGNLKSISNYLRTNLYSSIDQVEKIDLNGDGNYIYVVQSHCKIVIGDDDESKKIGNAFDCIVFDKDQNYLATLFTFYDDYNDTYVEYKSDVIYADIDNDSKMEILLHIPEWEGPGYVSIYKYENGKIIGDTDLCTGIAP